MGRSTRLETQALKVDVINNSMIAFAPARGVRQAAVLVRRAPACLTYTSRSSFMDTPPGPEVSS